MTSSVQHHHHQQDILTRLNNDDDDGSSLYTPPLPNASDHPQIIKTEPPSPSAAQQRHIATAHQGQGLGQGHVQGQTDREASSAGVTLGNFAATTTSQLTTLASSSSSIVFETDLSTDAAVVLAKHARIELESSANDWHPLD